MIRKFTDNGFEHIVLENDLIRAEFLPAIGGKMIKLINKKTGTDFLFPPQRPYKQAYHGAPFEKYDTSGFDECFPTVEACELVTKSEMKIKFPDHGQLWSRAWDTQVIGAETFMRTVKGVNWNYSFKKYITLEENRLVIDYEIENKEEEPLPYIWSAHPLLNVEQDDEIYLTDDVKKVMVNWSSCQDIGNSGDELTWPMLDKTNDYSKVQSLEFGKAVKLFSERLNEPGWAALHKPKSKESFLISFDSKKNPFMGIWLCYGGWPVDAEQKHLTIALEPTNGRPDSLARAFENGECGILNYNEKHNWKIELSIVNEN